MVLILYNIIKYIHLKGYNYVFQMVNDYNLLIFLHYQYIQHHLTKTINKGMIIQL